MTPQATQRPLRRLARCSQIHAMNDPIRGEAFQDPPRIPADDAAFILRLEAYEGPIDLLLDQARGQKVDLTQISILALANQYLDFVERAQRLRLELAADYLVMAAWLAYLKSRLLLPEEADDDEPSAAEMAEALAFQLRRLEAIRSVSGRLMARPQLGVDWFARGAPEPTMIVTKSVLDVSLYEVLKAYAGHKQRDRTDDRLHIHATELYSMDQALKRLTEMLGQLPGWSILASFLPTDIVDPLVARSAVAATFAASLELAKTGTVQLRQDHAFDDIHIRRAVPQEQK